MGPEARLGRQRTEPNGPVLLSAAGVPGEAHAQGIAVVTGRVAAPDPDGREESGDEQSAFFGSIGNAAAVPTADTSVISTAIAGFDEADLALLRTRVR